jgi:putative iron-regulated protein
MRRTLIGLFFVLGCSAAEGPRAPDARAAEDAQFAQTSRDTVKGYAKVGRAVHDEAVTRAKLMEKAIEDFTKAPSPENLELAKAEWRKARDAYARALAFRFAGSPFDTDAALAKRIDDPSADYAALDALVLDHTALPDVTAPALLTVARERGVALGWHAIAAVLARPATDFDAVVTAGGDDAPPGAALTDGARRGKLAAKIARILIEDLDLVAFQWDAQRTNSFAQKLVNGSLDEAFRRSLGSASRAVREPWAGATCEDLAATVKGTEALLLAREGRVTAPSFVDLVRRDDGALADTVSAAVQDAQAAPCAAGSQQALAARIDEILRHYAL